MQRISHVQIKFAAAAVLAGAVATACGGGADAAAAAPAPAPAPAAAKGQASLEVYAELTQSGIAAITQMQNGKLIIGYHPFYLTPTSVQVATLNDDKKSSTTYPPTGSGLLKSCRNPDGSFLPAQSGRYDFCLDWVLGFHADANGILWILDGAKSTDQATGATAKRPAALHAKYVGWDTKTNKLFKIIDLDAVTIPSSQHNDFAIDAKRNLLILADEAVGDANNAALVVSDIAAGTSRRLLQGDSHVIANPDPIRWVAQAGLPAASWGLGVGVDGITLDKNQEWLYFAPLGGYEMYRAKLDDIANASLTNAQLSARVEFYAKKPYNGGLTIDANNNLYLTEVGAMTIGIIRPDTRKYETYVTDPNMIWPDGVSYNSDGFMYSGAAQLIQTGTFQDNATPKGTANNKPPYRIY